MTQLPRDITYNVFAIKNGNSSGATGAGLGGQVDDAQISMIAFEMLSSDALIYVQNNAALCVVLDGITTDDLQSGNPDLYDACVTALAITGGNFVSIAAVV